MKLKFSWSAAGVIFSAGALALAIWLAFTSGSLWPPNLEFGFGATKAILGGDLRKGGLSKNGPVTYLAVMTKRLDVPRAAFIVPFYVTNRSKHALHNVVARFSYPDRVMAKFDKITLVDPPGTFAINPDYVKFRTSNTNGSVATAEFRFDMLRPGDGEFVGDMILLAPALPQSSSSTRSTVFDQLRFPNRLAERLELFDVVRINAFVAAEEAGPYTADLTVIWCRSDAGLKDAAAIGDRISEAAWGGYRPKPGWHLKWPWESRLSTVEFFEITYAPLLKGVDKDGRPLYIQDLEETGIASFSTSMPNWDYWGPVER